MIIFRKTIFKEIIVKTILFLTFIILFFTTKKAICHPFADIEENHWAQKAVLELAKKGLIEGPDGKNFFGDRSISRYEMTKIIERFLLKIKADYIAKDNITTKNNLATKEELVLLQRLALELGKEFSKEFNGLISQVSEKDKEMDKLDDRITTKENLKIYYKIDAIANTQSVNKKGSNFRQAFDFTSGRPLAPDISNNNFLTSVAVLGLDADLSSDFIGGLEIAAFGISGLTTAGLASSYWGVTPPYSNNWWTGQEVRNNIALEKAWIEHRQSETRGTFGAFSPHQLGGYLAKGEPNPTYYGPEYLPFYGLNFYGPLDYMKLPFIKWELFYSELPNQAPYYASIAGGNLSFDLRWVNFSFDYINAQNESRTNDLANSGPVFTPFSNPFNLVDPDGNSFYNTGIQKLNLFGFKIKPKILKDHHMELEFASSQYEPDKTNFFTTSSSRVGQLIRFNMKGALWGGLYGLDYISVDPDYDPFILGYPGNAVVRNWAIWNNISNFYFIHDTVTYPHNRTGLKLQYQHQIPSGFLFAYGSFLQQKFSTSELQANFPVHIEPTFSGSPNFGITTPFPFLSQNKGSIAAYGVQLVLSPLKKLNTDLGFSHTNLRRAEDLALSNNTLTGGKENWASSSNNYSINLNYVFTPRLSAQADFAKVDFGGTLNGFEGYAVNQNRYGFGLSYNLSATTAIAIGYRHYVTQEGTPERTSYALSSQSTIYGDSNAQMLLARLKMAF